MNIVIFNIDKSYHMACSDIPNSDYLNANNWIITYLPEGEDFDDNYSYAPVDGVAVKGDLIAVDQSAIDAMMAEVAAVQYKENRKVAYPSIEDQLDDIYHNGVDAWKTTIQAVKDANPKPE